MGIIRRLILLFYVLIIMAALVICAGVCLNLIPANLWRNELEFIIGREETLMALAAMMFASLILLTGIFSRRKSSSIMLNDVHLEAGGPGEVKVTVPAIIGVVERAAITINGVREVEATLHRQDGAMPIKIKLTITLGQGFSAPRVSEAVVAAVDAALSTALELPNVPVEVKVNEITHAIVEREKRVV